MLPESTIVMTNARFSELINKIVSYEIAIDQFCYDFEEGEDKFTENYEKFCEIRNRKSIFEKTECES
jgi:hypothetical protein